MVFRAAVVPRVGVGGIEQFLEAGAVRLLEGFEQVFHLGAELMVGLEPPDEPDPGQNDRRKKRYSPNPKHFTCHHAMKEPKRKEEIWPRKFIAPMSPPSS
jgi:hypothetical protein